MRIPAVVFASALALTTHSLYASGSSSLPDGWSLEGEAPKLYSAGVDLDDSPSGNGSMVLQRTEAAHPYGSAMLLQSIPTADYAGKRVRLSMRIRAEGVLGTNAGIAIKDSHGMHTQTMDNLRGWKLQRKILTFPASAQQLAIGVTLKGPGTIKVDEIRLEPLDDAPAGQIARQMVTLEDERK